MHPIYLDDACSKHIDRRDSTTGKSNRIRRRRYDNIKAQLALNAAGNINSLGSISATNAAAAKIGISNKVVAMLLVDSVMMLTEKHKINNIKNNGNVVKIETASPTVTLKPETTNALAIQIPPANNSSIPQGISVACCQVSKFYPALLAQ